MSKLFFSILIFVSTSLQAKPPASDFSRAQELWNSFRACQTLVSDELKLINCVDGLISPSVTRYEKGKLASYLIMGFSFSELHSCESIKDLLPLRPAKDEKYFCMDVLGNTSKRPGYIGIKQDKDRFKLTSIKYND